MRAATAPGRLEVCTDGFEAYPNAIDAGLHDRVDYSQIIKVYSKQEEGRERCSPGEFVTLESHSGQPGHGSGLHVARGTAERSPAPVVQALTRLTYAFFKNWDNLKAALAQHFAYYNFCRVHRSLRQALETPYPRHEPTTRLPVSIAIC